MKNKAMAIEAIMNDCEIRFAYVDDKGKTCAIAGLVKAAAPEFDLDSLKIGGTNSARVAYRPDSLVRGVGPSDTEPLRKILEEHYGFTPIQMSEIQTTNDHFSDPDDRKKEVARLVESFPED